MFRCWLTGWIGVSAIFSLELDLDPVYANGYCFRFMAEVREVRGVLCSPCSVWAATLNLNFALLIFIMFAIHWHKWTCTNYSPWINAPRWPINLRSFRPKDIQSRMSCDSPESRRHTNFTIIHFGFPLGLSFNSSPGCFGLLCFLRNSSDPGDF